MDAGHRGRRSHRWSFHLEEIRLNANCASQTGKANLAHLFHADCSPEDLQTLRDGLARVPGSDEGRALIWERFQFNYSTVGVLRDADGRIAFFVFFEVHGHEPSSAREFFISGACALDSTLLDATGKVVPQLERFARCLDCQSMKVQTPRPGLVVKLVEHHGFFVDREGVTETGSKEFLLRKRL